MVNQVKKVSQVRLVDMEHLVSKDLQDPLAVDKDHQDLLDLKDHEASEDHLDRRDWMDLMEMLDLEDQSVQRVDLEYLENLAQKECLVKRAKKEHMAKLVYLAQWVREV